MVRLSAVSEGRFFKSINPLLEMLVEQLADKPVKDGSYVAVVLDDSSRNALLSWWKNEVGDLLPNLFAHHMTLKFQPSPNELAAFPIGEPATLKVVGIGKNEKGQAVKVTPSVKSANPIPHVTVAVAPGTKPVYSNELLKDGVQDVSGPTLKGTVQHVRPGR